MPHPMPRPAPGAVDVLLLPLTGAAVSRARARADCLSVEERWAAGRFLRTADSELYLLAHVGLRHVLGRYLDRPPEALRMSRAACPRCGGPHGRPEVQDPDGLSWSLSHASGLVLVAVAADPVGVDVEPLGRPTADEAVLRELHHGERAHLAALPEPARGDAFVTCWVRKEAYLKGTGAGLSGGVGWPYVGFGGSDPLAPDAGPWRLADLALPAGHAGAVALRWPHAPSVAVRPAYG